ncbi:hypothetical protein NE237_007853 [Protea cynaroides]|uniref:RING-CH-type domain-containing protein n=1 Tax=Protea cynaroides TaxID=273540 RepID=A0A9Q0KQY8_9MAGN|nr:hypothetical protein NE237_007853 [Protea cynaroides]
MAATDQQNPSSLAESYHHHMQNPQPKFLRFFSPIRRLYEEHYPPGFLRKVVAEIIATFLLVFVTCGSAALNRNDEGKVSRLGASIAGGLIVTVMIYAVGHISGAHMNPAVTFAFATVKHFPWKQVPFYAIAQVSGGMAASFTLGILLHPIKNLGTTSPSGSSLQALVMEIVVTFSMMFITSAVATDTKAIGELAGIAVGSAVCITSILAGPISGGSMNPARSIGPAVASGSYKGIWLFRRSNTGKQRRSRLAGSSFEDRVSGRMGDHLVLYVDRLITPDTLQSMPGAEVPGPSAEGSCTQTAVALGSTCEDKRVLGPDVSDEEEPLIQTLECRICQEEDHIKNLETPCACCGSLKYAHRKCVQRWCNEKGDIICEICHQPYQPGYTAPPPPQSEETAIDISGGWTISSAPLDLHDPRLIAMAAAERHFLEAEYDEYAATNASGAAFCHSAALILMALLLLRHALTITNADGDDDLSTFFSLFLLRAAGFLLPCYIMAWAISILQRRRQSQEAAALAATEVAFVLQSGQHRGLQFTIAGPSVTPRQEPIQ